MWLEIAKTGASLLGSVIGQQQAAKAQSDANKELNKMQAQENTRYYNNMGDSLHRADVAELSKQVYDNVRQVNQQANNPISNNTVEGANAVRDKNTEMTRQMAATVNTDNTKLRMDNENQHATALNNISQGRAKVAAAKAEQIGKATTNVVNALTGIGTSINKPAATSTSTAVSTTATQPAAVAPAKVVTDKTTEVVAPVEGAADVTQARQRNLFDGLFG